MLSVEAIAPANLLGHCRGRVSVEPQLFISLLFIIPATTPGSPLPVHQLICCRASPLIPSPLISISIPFSSTSFSPLPSPSYVVSFFKMKMRYHLLLGRLAQEQMGVAGNQFPLPGLLADPNGHTLSTKAQSIGFVRGYPVFGHGVRLPSG